MVASQPQSSAVHTTALAAALMTIGAGLVVAAWLGRGAGLVAAGAGVALVLVLGTTLAGIPHKVGSFTWRPAAVAELEPEYVVGIGDGVLDLSGVALAPGSRTRVAASVTLGRLEVIVPPQARAEVRGRTRLGEVQIGPAVRSGPDIRHRKVLEPKTTGPGAVPVVELHLTAGIGDLAVRHAL